MEIPLLECIRLPRTSVLIVLRWLCISVVFKLFNQIPALGPTATEGQGQMNTNPFQRRPVTAYNFGQLALMQCMILSYMDDVDLKPKSSNLQKTVTCHRCCNWHEMSLMWKSSIDNHQSFFFIFFDDPYASLSTPIRDNIQVGGMSNDQVRNFFHITPSTTVSDKYFKIRGDRPRPSLGIRP